MPVFQPPSEVEKGRLAVHDQTMSRTWRRVLSAKAVALSLVLLAALVATALAHRRQLDARSTHRPTDPPHTGAGGVSS